MHGCAHVGAGQRVQVCICRLYVLYRDRFSSGKPTIRPVLKRNVAADTEPFVLQRVGGRRTAGYTFCPEAKNELNSRERRVFVRERRNMVKRDRASERERERKKELEEKEPQNNCSPDEFGPLIPWDLYPTPDDPIRRTFVIQMG